MEKKVYRMEVDENDQDSGVFALSLVEFPAIEENFVYLSKQKEIKLATIDEEKRIVVGPALVPNKQIPRIDENTGEEYFILFPEDTVRLAAQLYLKRQMNNNTTLEHSEGVEDISVVESWIVNDPLRDKSNSYGMEPEVGTWMVVMKIQNDSVWTDYVKTGKVKGLSLEGNFSFKEMELSEEDKNLQEIKKLLSEYFTDSI